MQVYPASLYTYARNWLNDCITDVEIPEGGEKFETWVQDLAEELQAAVDDRLANWMQSRRRGLPLGEIERCCESTI